VSTTYTITNPAHDGFWAPNSPAWTTTDTVADAGEWAVMHFAIGTWTHTLLSSAVTLTFTPKIAIGGVLEILAVISRDAVPTATTVPNYRLDRVGLLTLTGDSLSAGTLVTIDLTTASSQVSLDTTYAYAPVVGALGVLNGAWTKHDRDDATGAFLDRSVTLVVRQFAGTGFLNIEDADAADGPTLTVTTGSSNTGLDGLQYIRDLERGVASGITICPKTGFEVPTDELVRDGFTGLMVSPLGYDPPEPRKVVKRSTPTPRRS
jgi:hypothetical protein